MPMLSRIRTALAVCSATLAFAADSPPLPPGLPALPSDLPVQSPAPAATLNTPSPVPEPSPAIRRPRISVSRPLNIQAGNGKARSVSSLRPNTYQAPPTVPDNVLSWDALAKEYTAKPGELSANFSFKVTNVGKSNVVINWVRPSCGCTVAKLPPTPWTLAPGDGGNIDLTVDLRGKFGTLSKYVSVETSAGQKLLNLKITVPTTAAGTAPVMDARTRNRQLAMADRQAVFKGDCASCHATPTAGKMGEDLFRAGCAICHDTPHRASMVPDLRALKTVTGRDYWVHWITEGKPGSLMPAFAKAQGGPLTDEQIQSLAAWLDEHFPKNATASASSQSSASLGLPAPNAARN